jgi:DNA repair exonuclease SbcCD nuclease subunit
MRIAIFSDPHLGYARFESDSYIQAERAIISASERSDLILCAGDIFDIKVPKLETIKKAMEIFGKAKAPVFAIHGNHERRPKESVNPVELLVNTRFRLLHMESVVHTIGDESVQVLGVGSVPEEYASIAVRRAAEGFVKQEGAFTILMIHQSIKELVPGGADELSLEYLETLPFDLIINGHIHETTVKLGGRFLIPGSTVITQLKESETEGKGYFLYDTAARKAEFVPIESRAFFYETIVFEKAGLDDVRAAVRARIDGKRKEHPDSIIALKLDGSLKEGLSSSDLQVGEFPGAYIENRLNVESLGTKLAKIREGRDASLSAKELALKELSLKTAGKISLFDSSELFEMLAQSPDETLAYLEGRNKKKNEQRA